jgi:uncharacterized protein YqeY
MSLLEKINSDMKEAMKSKDSLKLSTIRLLRSGITHEEKKAGTSLTDEQVIDVLFKEIKKRNESIDAFKKGGRTDLAEKEQKELEILRELCPELTKPMTEEDVRTIVKEVMAGIPKEESPKLGKIMQLVLPKTKGRIDGQVVNRIVREEMGQ